MIVDELGHDLDGERTIRNGCSLVSHAFRRASIRNLFREICLRRFSEKYSYAAFTSVVLNAPHLTSCVRRLILCLISINLDTLGTIVSMLPQLRDVSLAGVGLSSGSSSRYIKHGLHSLSLGLVYSGGGDKISLLDILCMFPDVKLVTLSTIMVSVLPRLGSEDKGEPAFWPSHLRLRDPTPGLLALARQHFAPPKALTVMCSHSGGTCDFSSFVHKISPDILRLKLAGDFDGHLDEVGEPAIRTIMCHDSQRRHFFCHFARHGLPPSWRMHPTVLTYSCVR